MKSLTMTILLPNHAYFMHDSSLSLEEADKIFLAIVMEKQVVS